MRRLLAVAGLALVAALLVVYAFWWRGGSNGRPITFSVEQGASVSSVAQDLEAKGLIDSAAIFRGFARIFGGSDPVQAG